MVSQPHLIKAPPGMNNTVEESWSENRPENNPSNSVAIQNENSNSVAIKYNNPSNNDMDSSDEETESHPDLQTPDSDPN